jgi:beta-alanine--pyruvate transaminase
MAPIFKNAIHKLRGERHVIDVRNLGLVGGIGAACWCAWVACL